MQPVLWAHACAGRVQEDAAELVRSRQMHAASQIFKTQHKQYEPAHMKDLEKYIVSGGSATGSPLFGLVLDACVCMQ